MERAIRQFKMNILRTINNNNVHDQKTYLSFADYFALIVCLTKDYNSSWPNSPFCLFDLGLKFLFCCQNNFLKFYESDDTERHHDMKY